MNTLAYDACFWNEAGRDRGREITLDDIVAAPEQLILGREMRLDQLADKLQEDRIRWVIERLQTGGDRREFSTRDIEYVLLRRSDAITNNAIGGRGWESNPPDTWYASHRI